ncbi:ribulose-phosphate 3-epimerase [Enterobacteriaceae endosymbiont of Donacia bicoloricornis]|uniref:ribulose-phosphate 3-epimerase n=1 Tax=Enterobacteriaceae endosymbiont of Donacia bicoloricornis TaxID=2675772 RepID=UPI00144A247F|nr:ribulose-phosphate 3-epimerase [Enterobacteriaceae endosymbiont of Donacia bicoloricornis]QJC37854.1 ribulose-phosphate 3-epimerase [Enterobacteriaceae endosymbiont of Donacia bicoloricornis]
MKNKLIAASILSANFACLGKEINDVLEAGVDKIHFDVMDNHYVPNLTVGPLVLKSLRKNNIKCEIDIHLMTKKIDNLIINFAKLGANSIIIHPESSKHLDRSISLIKNYGCKAGLALNPSTSLNYLDYLIHKLDLILVMSVNPGFEGQKFLNYIYKKIIQIRKIINKKKKKILLEVDGGINIDNITNIAVSGADVFIIGSTLFKSKLSYSKIIKDIRLKLSKIY